jgi:LPXTG-motif cell wall-anchored protein
MTTGESDQILLAAAGLGLLVAVPLVAKALRDYLKRRRPPSPGARDPGPH